MITCTDKMWQDITRAHNVYSNFTHSVHSTMTHGNQLKRLSEKMDGSIPEFDFVGRLGITLSEV